MGWARYADARVVWGPKMIFAPAPGIFLRWVTLTGAVLALALAAGLLLPGTAGAQGSDRDEVRHRGAHDVRVVPVNYNLGAGSAQFSVFVTDPATGAAVPDARVIMVTNSEEESNPGWAFATNSPAAPGRYDAHLKLDSTGRWDISVDVSSGLGADIVAVATVEVPALNRLTQGSWVFFGMFGIILLGIGYVWWSARRDYLKKRAAQADSR